VFQPLSEVSSPVLVFSGFLLGSLQISRGSCNKGDIERAKRNDHLDSLM